MSEMAVRIMGETWTILEGTEEDYPGLTGADGYTDTSTRTIVVADMKACEGESDAKKNLQGYKKTVLRHELIHAFLYESGLGANTGMVDSWAMNEEMVDWIAIQAPKIIKLFLELDLV